jgi:hypothetical protein
LIALSPLGIGGGLALPVPRAVPEVRPGSRFGVPDGCAAPELLVPRGDALLFANAAGFAHIATVATRAKTDSLIMRISVNDPIHRPVTGFPGEHAGAS